jgi:acyl-coenzyme A thioesterase PaaI-like protein
MSTTPWAGGDFQEPTRGEGGVAMCGACLRTGRCRLGLTTERLDEDGVAHFDLVCPPEHEGGPGVAHGGWTAGVLDEVLGHVPLLNHQLSVTGTLTVTFVKPVPLGRQLEARSWVAERLERKWHIEGELLLASSGAVLAKGRGTFVLRRFEDHFNGFERWLADQ